MKRVCVYCGSSFGRNEAYKSAAIALGRLLADRRIELVYGGGNVGLMGATADAVLDHGGYVIGVIPHSLKERELAHEGAQEMRVVATMHERKAIMTDLSDAFVVLPGGLGTLDETFEAITWAQLGIHRKPVGLFNVDGYYDALLRFLDEGNAAGFIPDDTRQTILVDDDSGRLVDKLAAAEMPTVKAWTMP